VAKAIQTGECHLGVLICGTGLGISIAANKVKGIIAAPVSDTFSAEMARKHNNANILAMGERVVGHGLAMKIVDAFFDSEFEGGRHADRVAKILAIEEECL
jgi:ribose 5-phosphate isomerase B